MPESSKVLNSLDPGLRRDDVVSGKYVFLTGHQIANLPTRQVQVSEKLLLVGILFSFFSSSPCLRDSV